MMKRGWRRDEPKGERRRGIGEEGKEGRKNMLVSYVLIYSDCLGYIDSKHSPPSHTSTDSKICTIK